MIILISANKSNLEENFVVKISHALFLNFDDSKKSAIFKKSIYDFIYYINLRFNLKELISEIILRIKEFLNYGFKNNIKYSEIDIEVFFYAFSIFAFENIENFDIIKENLSNLIKNSENYQFESKKFEKIFDCFLILIRKSNLIVVDYVLNDLSVYFLENYTLYFCKKIKSKIKTTINLALYENKKSNKLSKSLEKKNKIFEILDIFLKKQFELNSIFLIFFNNSLNFINVDVNYYGEIIESLLKYYISSNSSIKTKRIAKIILIYFLSESYNCEIFDKYYNELFLVLSNNALKNDCQINLQKIFGNLIKAAVNKYYIYFSYFLNSFFIINKSKYTNLYLIVLKNYFLFIDICFNY